MLCRVIVDDGESAVVFNGLVPLVDAMFTNTNNYITGRRYFTLSTSIF